MKREDLPWIGIDPDTRVEVACGGCPSTFWLKPEDVGTWDRCARCRTRDHMAALAAHKADPGCDHCLRHPCECRTVAFELHPDVCRYCRQLRCKCNTVLPVDDERETP